MPQPPSSPAPPPPSLNLQGSQSDFHYNVSMEAETPLIGSGRKTAPPVRPTHHTQLDYGAIQEMPSKDDEEEEDEEEADDTDDDRSVATTSSLTSLSSITTVAENFKEGLLIPFTDSEGSPEKVVWGLSSLCVVGTLVGLIMPKVVFDGGRWYPYYRYVSNIIGYNYFVLWSICFYPQVLLNYRRESTKGLSNDFAILNLMGWTFYSLYIASMYFSHDIKDMYSERFGGGESSVQSNDVLFSFHAMILSAIYVLQIIYYGGKSKYKRRRRHLGGKKRRFPFFWIIYMGVSQFKFKPQTWFLILGMGLPTLIMPFLILTDAIEYDFLDYFYMLSFFKICCTLTKYSKQTWLNYSRKSTKGWNIWYNFLECSGGLLSMLQVVLDSVDMRNMAGITGNLAKFALGLATLFFDGIFFTQHYILYPHIKEEEDDLLLDNDTEQQIINGESSYTSSRGRHIRASSRFHIPDINVPEEIGVGTSLEEAKFDNESLRSAGEL